MVAAKGRFDLPAETAVVSCYEAGRDGFWLHRCLGAMGVKNEVVDSSSIEVNRRKRRRGGQPRQPHLRRRGQPERDP